MEMNQLMILRASLEDLDKLQNICKQTFSETFTTGNSLENIEKYSSENFTIDKLKTELNNKNSLFFFALHNGDIVGYLKLNFKDAQTELKNDNTSIEIERIYILKKYWKSGIGQALYQKTLDIATERGLGYIWLGVWEHNHQAIKFYERNNFIPFDKHTFKLGDDIQNDIMMKFELK